MINSGLSFNSIYIGFDHKLMAALKLHVQKKIRTQFGLRATFFSVGYCSRYLTDHIIFNGYFFSISSNYYHCHIKSIGSHATMSWNLSLWIFSIFFSFQFFFSLHKIVKLNFWCAQLPQNNRHQIQLRLIVWGVKSFFLIGS